MRPVVPSSFAAWSDVLNPRPRLDLHKRRPYSPTVMKFSTFSTIAEITSGLRTKEFSAGELLSAHFEQIRRLQPKLNAFTHLDESPAIAQASAADEKANAAAHDFATLGSLHGVPLTIKSCIDVAQWPCPAGSRLRRNYRPASDAPIVAPPKIRRRHSPRQHQHARKFNVLRN